MSTRVGLPHIGPCPDFEFQQSFDVLAQYNNWKNSGSPSLLIPIPNLKPGWWLVQVYQNSPTSYIAKSNSGGVLLTGNYTFDSRTDSGFTQGLSVADLNLVSTVFISGNSYQATAGHSSGDRSVFLGPHPGTHPCPCSQTEAGAILLTIVVSPITIGASVADFEEWNLPPTCVFRITGHWEPSLN